jgi:hypothetical protein
MGRLGKVTIEIRKVVAEMNDGGIGGIGGIGVGVSLAWRYCMAASWMRMVVVVVVEGGVWRRF